MIINSCNLIRYKNSNFTPMLQIYTKGYGVKFTDQVFHLTSIDTKVKNVSSG